MPRDTTTKTSRRTRSSKAATPAKKPAAVTLDDLSPADRKRLLAEARSSAGSDDAKAEGRAEKVREAIASRIGMRDHLRDCPVGDGEPGRVEVYASVRPPRPADGIPRKDVTVARCIECGGSTVIEKPLDVVTAEIESEVT